MFLIFTKENCLSSNKAISFLKDDGQIYKEINSNISFIDKNHLNLLEKASENNLRKFIREKSDYIINNQINWKTLTNDESKKILSSNLKEVASFPIIVQLSFDGKAKNCMIGFSEKILSKWIDDENINGMFVDINKMFGSDECCYLDKKDKMISAFKKINSMDDDIRVSLNSLYELKRKNNSNIGVYEKKYDELSLLKDDTEKLHQKYNDAISQINESHRNPEYVNFQNDDISTELINRSADDIISDDGIDIVINDVSSKESFNNQIDNVQLELPNSIEKVDENHNNFHEEENNINNDEVELLEIKNDTQEDNLIIDDNSEFIKPIETEEKEKDYSFEKSETKYDEYVSVNENTILENTSVFNENSILKKNNDKNNNIEYNKINQSNDIKNDNTPDIKIIEEVSNDSEFITINLSDENLNIDSEFFKNNKNKNNFEDFSSSDWLQKYELSDQEIDHQKEVDNEK